jgi:hypothetical protein
VDRGRWLKRSSLDPRHLSCPSTRRGHDHWQETVAGERVGSQLPQFQPAWMCYVGAALAAGLARYTTSS